MNTNVAGALINSALVLVMIFVAGLASGQRWSCVAAIVAVGLTFVSHVAQITLPVRTSSAAWRLVLCLVAASWLAAVAAFILLFV